MSRKNSLDYKTVLNLYLAMPKHQRSLRKLHKELTHKYDQMSSTKSSKSIAVVPNVQTFMNWSAKNNWQQLCVEFDEKINHKFNEKVINKRVNDLDAMQSIVTDLRQNSFLALQKITKALKSNVMQEIKTPQDIKSLTDAVSTSLKAYNLMCGGFTSRSESISHNVSNDKKVIREEIMQLIGSLASDGINIQMDNDKSKLN
jgi:hypothetical protein